MGEVESVLVDFMEKGGPILWLICFISVAGVVIFFERLFYLVYIKRKLMRMREMVRKLAKQGRLSQIRAVCRDSNDPFSKVIVQLISMVREGKEVNSDTLSFLVYSEVSKTEKNFTFLRTLITISPLSGLLGTVTGMIKIFKSIEPTKLQGSVLYETKLADGISEALYTTVGGLVVAILLSLFLSILHEMRSRYETVMMEELHGIFSYMRDLSVREALK